MLSSCAHWPAALGRTPPAERAARAPGAGADAAPTEIDSTLTLAAARLRRGQLLRPRRRQRTRLSRSRAPARRDQFPGGRAYARSSRPRWSRPRDSSAASDPVAASSIAAEARRQGAAARRARRSRDRADRVAQEPRATRGVPRASAPRATSFARGAVLAAGRSRARRPAACSRRFARDGRARRRVGRVPRCDSRGAVETAVTNGNTAAAEAGLAALREAPARPREPRAVAELAARRQQERYLATAVQSSELQLINAPPAVYPGPAAYAGVEGWVEVEFIVDLARSRN